MKKQPLTKNLEPLPLFKTVEQMAKISGIGENTLRRLIESGKVEYIAVGNRKLLTEDAIMAWYRRNRVGVVDNVQERLGA
ncbi:MAG: helix-turn-helix domain-containing protein [Ruminococcaceae bacterium]|nr:helix-turn-helix domain-containing protein [Oscillospiraceae bacterium]